MEKIDYKTKLENSTMRDADGDYGFTVHVKKAYEICLELELYYLTKLKELESKLSSIKVVGEVTPKVEITKEEILERGKKIDLLEAYSLFLEKNGYMDVDWRSEEPFAIDEFLRLSGVDK